MWIKNIYIILIIVFTLATTSCETKTVELTCDISQNSQRAINHMQPLIDALEKYKVENGRYPQYFNDLIPKYIQRIPMIGNEKIVPGSPVYDHLVDEKLGDSIANMADGGNWYYIRFYPKDDRICLLGGRNNICEYTSETKQWNCYQ